MVVEPARKARRARRQIVGADCEIAGVVAAAKGRAVRHPGQAR